MAGVIVLVAGISIKSITYDSLNNNLYGLV